jgi:hypothetical protein
MSQEKKMVPLARRYRVCTMRDFIMDTFNLQHGTTVLDIAGGKGELSWFDSTQTIIRKYICLYRLLLNADGLDSVVCDPRVTDHTKVPTMQTINVRAFLHFD